MNAAPAQLLPAHGRFRPYGRTVLIQPEPIFGRRRVIYRPPERVELALQQREYVELRRVNVSFIEPELNRPIRNKRGVTKS